MIYEEYAVWRDESLCGFVRCSDFGWEYSADGVAFDNRAAATSAAAIPYKPREYRLAVVN